MSDLTREQLRQMHLVRVEGQLVERDALNIAEKITNYDPNLYLQVLEHSQNPLDPPFRVMERCRDGIDRVAFTAWHLDDRILQRIYAADTGKFDILKELDAANNRVRNEDRRRYQDRNDQAAEIVADVLKSNKTEYTVKMPDIMPNAGTVIKISDHKKYTKKEVDN